MFEQVIGHFNYTNNIRLIPSLAASVMESIYGLRQATVCLVSDITELKKSEVELKRHLDHLEELVEEKTEEMKSVTESVRGLSRHLERERGRDNHYSAYS